MEMLESGELDLEDLEVRHAAARRVFQSLMMITVRIIVGLFQFISLQFMTIINRWDNWC